MFLRRRLVFQSKGVREVMIVPNKHYKQQKYSLIKYYESVFEASFGLLVRGCQRAVDSVKKSSQTAEVFFDKIV